MKYLVLLLPLFCFGQFKPVKHTKRLKKTESTVSAKEFKVADIDSLSYGDANNFERFRMIKNNTTLNTYLTSNNSVLRIGDTLRFGTPISKTSGTFRGSGFQAATTKTNQTYRYITYGKPGGFGKVLFAMQGHALSSPDISMQGEKVILVNMKVLHKGGIKKPLQTLLTLGEINGHAFGAYKYMAVSNADLAIEQGEIVTSNTPITRKQAIIKLKEAKDLLDLDIITRSEYDEMKKRLTPVIKNQKK